MASPQYPVGTASTMQWPSVSVQAMQPAGHAMGRIHLAVRTTARSCLASTYGARCNPLADPATPMELQDMAHVPARLIPPGQALTRDGQGPPLGVVCARPAWNARAGWAHHAGLDALDLAAGLDALGALPRDHRVDGDTGEVRSVQPISATAAPIHIVKVSPLWPDLRGATSVR